MWGYYGTVFLLFAVALLLARDVVANFVWEQVRWDAAALAINKEDVNLSISIGAYYFGGGGPYNLDKAERAFEVALGIDPNVSGVHYQLGRINFIRGDFGKAIYELGREMELHPEYLRPLYVRGLVYGYQDLSGDLERAEEDFAAFVEWAPEEWAGYNDLAWIQTKLEKFDDARATVERAFKNVEWVRAGNPWLWSTLGVAELNLRNYGKARDAFLNARRYARDVDAAYFLSAYPGNDSRNAEEIYSQYLATLSFNLGIAFEGIGDRKAAISEYEAYLAQLPEGPYPQRAEIEEKLRELEVE